MVACATAIFPLSLQPLASDGWEGFAEPYQTVEVAAPEPGLITEVLVEEGARVQEGQSLLQQDVALLESALATAQVRRDATGRSSAAEVELALRKDRLQRLMKLFEKGSASREEVDRAEADVQIAEANLLTIQEEQKVYGLECKRIEMQIKRRAVRSPIDGVVIKRHYEPGESVSATDLTVATVIRIDPLRVVVYVPANSIDALAVNGKVKVRLQNHAEDEAGTVEYIAPVVDAQSGTIKVHVLVPNPQNRIRSGSRCTIRPR